MSDDIDFRDVTPGSDLDVFHYELWGGCMQFLIGQDEVRARFEQETGTPPISFAQTPFEAMINKACGVDPRGYVAAFCKWATPSYWGDETDISPAIAAKIGTDST